MKNIFKLIMVTILVAISLTVVAFAAVDEENAEVVIDIVPVDGKTDIYEITATYSAFSTMQTINFRFTLDKDFTPVNASTYANIVVPTLRKQAIAALNDPTLEYPFNLQISNVIDNGDTWDIEVALTADPDVRDYHMYTDFTIWKAAFKYTGDVDALTSEQFNIQYALVTVNNPTEGIDVHQYGYKFYEDVDYTLNVINNVAAEAPAAPEAPAGAAVESTAAVEATNAFTFSTTFTPATEEAVTAGFIATASDVDGFNEEAPALSTKKVELAATEITEAVAVKVMGYENATSGATIYVIPYIEYTNGAIIYGEAVTYTVA